MPVESGSTNNVRGGVITATILVVDDEEPLREVLTMVIEDLGHRALQAINGRQALDVVHTERPDLIISDVMMPVMTGVELCQQLREETRQTGATHVPVILMSSAGAQAAAGAEPDAFIAKPFDLDNVVRHVLLYLSA